MYKLSNLHSVVSSRGTKLGITGFWLCHYMCCNVVIKVLNEWHDNFYSFYDKLNRIILNCKHYLLGHGFIEKTWKTYVGLSSHTSRLDSSGITVNVTTLSLALFTNTLMGTPTLSPNISTTCNMNTRSYLTGECDYSLYNISILALSSKKGKLNSYEKGIEL